MAPVTSTAPLTTTWSYWVPAVVPSISTARTLPAFICRLPLIVRLPAPALPGDSKPPLLTVTLPPRVPVPARVAPLATVVALAVLPLTARVPAETVVMPA
ncbi:hypothetical protein D9M69_488470 [compost metagenome]